MTTPPIAEQTRRVLQLADGSVRYEVTTMITDKGDLPFTELFVLNITDPLAEKTDVLAHVVTPFELKEITDAIYVKVDSSSLKFISGDAFAAVADVVSFTQLPRDRITAVRQGAAQYLTSTVTLSYNSITAATAAYQTLLARLSTLVTDWRSFRDAFITSPVVDYPLPQVSIGVEDQLTAAFRKSQAATAKAQADRDKAQADLNACRTEDASNAAILSFLNQDISFLQAAKLVVLGLTETVSGLSITANPGTVIALTPAAPVGGYVLNGAASRNVGNFVVNGGDARSYESLLNQKLALRNTISAALIAGTAECATLARALSDAQQAVASAQAAQNAALSSLLAVCPTFTA